MDHFQPKGGVLHGEDVSLIDLAERVGTPTYVYARATIERHVAALERGIGDLPHVVCYAVKACSNLGILELLRDLGWGFDAVSLGELARVAHIHGPPEKTIVSGVGKTADEIRAAIAFGVRYLCVESEQELQLIDAIAGELGKRAPVSLRINPDVDAKTHPHIATGLERNKFGIPFARLDAVYARIEQSSHVELVGLSCHIGSQIVESDPFVEATERTVRAIDMLKQRGAPITHVGVGGGLGIRYDEETPPDPDTYGAALRRVVEPTGLTVVFEPGRVIVGNAGILLTRVVRKKRGASRTFVVVDAAMNDLMRPALYGAAHEIVPVAAGNTGKECVTVVGPVCETADTFAEDIELSDVEAGDLLAIRSAGAYGFVMASNYNSRPRPAEVLCDGATVRLLRDRETLEDLWRGEHLLSGRPLRDGDQLNKDQEGST